MGAALFLSVYNLYDARKAEESVNQASLILREKIDNSIQEKEQEEIKIPDYKSHFSGLKKLEEGSEIHFIDAEGNRFFMNWGGLR